ncbi:hypothetical protein ACLM5H_14300 [Fredinandcohnia humi]
MYDKMVGYYMGIIVGSWLILGFIVGIKIVFWDRSFQDLNAYVNETLSEEEMMEITKDFIRLIYKNRINFIILCSLLGLIVFVLDWIYVCRKESD